MQLISIFTHPMNVRIKKLNPLAHLPVRQSDGAGGYDLYGYDPKPLETNDYGYYEYRTYLSIEIPEGYVGLIYPRSSISKTGLILANSVGVIDSDYRGEILIRFKYIAGSKLYLHAERVAQLILQKIETIEFEELPNDEDLTETDRGSEGFGSTGDN